MVGRRKGWALSGSSQTWAAHNRMACGGHSRPTRQARGNAMNQVKQSPDTAASGPGSQNNSPRNNTITELPVKWCRVLAAFLAGRSFHRFDAERELNDHTLPSTVSYLQSRGVLIDREDITVPGYRGTPTRCTLYWLHQSPENRARAAELLGLGTATASNSDGGAT